MICPKKQWDWESCSGAVRKAVKKSWDSTQNHELGPAWGVEEQLLMFIEIAWTSQKASKVHKLLSQGWLSANLKHSKSIWRQLMVLWKLKNHNIESSGHNACSALLYRGDVPERSIYDNCRFDIGHFLASRLITKPVYTWVIHLQIAVPTITCSFRYA